MHAKLAVADRVVMLVTSANLTQSDVRKNIEAGLLIRGGAAPIRATEHVDALQSNGTLNISAPTRRHRHRPQDYRHAGKEQGIRNEFR